MLWIKALHIIFVTAWFAGLFYLPRLFVNHAMATDTATAEQLARMEQKLYRFMWPLAIIATGSGLYLWLNYHYANNNGNWIYAKILLVALLLAYHLYCGKLMRNFQNNPHSHIWYRWFNELPVIVLCAIVILVVVKPF